MSSEPTLSLVARQPQKLDAPTAEALVRWAIAAPFGPVTQQSVELDQSGPVDADRAVATLLKRRGPVVFTGSDDTFRVTLGSYRRLTTVGAQVGLPRVDAVAAVLHTWIGLLPHPQGAWASAHPDLASEYDTHALPWLPASFGYHLRWLHLLAPGFEAHLDVAALRALPGCTWHDLPDGAASLQTYADPARYAAPDVDMHRRETSERIRRAVR